jgi:hypothetical protein
VAVWGLQEREIYPDAVEPHDTVHPAALDLPLALQLESEFDENLGCGREVVNHDADVVHPLDRHVRAGMSLRAGERIRNRGGEVAWNDGEHDAVVCSPVRPAVRAQKTLSLEPRLLNGADGRNVLRCRLSVDPPEAKLERGPLRGESKRARTDSSAARLGKHRNRETGNLFVLAKLDVQEPQSAIGRRVSDDERCAST